MAHPPPPGPPADTPGRRTAVIGVGLGVALVAVVLAVVVRTLDSGASPGQACVRGDADPRWELALGGVEMFGDEGLLDAVGLEDDTVVVGVGASGSDASDVAGETVTRLLGVRDGEEVWSRDLSLLAGTEDGAGVLAEDGDGRLLRLNAAGEEVWAVDGAVARHEHDGRLVIETDDETRTAVLDVATGEVVAAGLGQYADASGDRVLVGTESADGVSLVGLDGSERWTVYPDALDVGDGIAGVLNGDLAVVGETQALPTVAGFDAGSGEEAWRVTEGLDDGSLGFIGPGPGGTVALTQSGEELETLLVDLTGEVAREPVLAETVYVEGEPMLLGNDDGSGAILYGAGLEEVASYDGEVVGPCGDGVYLTDGEDLVTVDWSGGEQGRVEDVVDPDEGVASLAVLGGALLLESVVESEGESEGESDGGAVLTLYD